MCGFNWLYKPFRRIVGSRSEKDEQQHVYLTAGQQVIVPDTTTPANASRYQHQTDLHGSNLRIPILGPTAEASQLHWVATEFIYFLDIPWNYELQDTVSSAADKSVSPHEQLSTGASARLSTRSITVDLLEDIMDQKIPEDSLLSRDSFGRKVLSANLLSHLVVPWARNLLEKRALISEPDPRHFQQGNHKLDLLKRVTTAIDDLVYSKTVSLLDDGPESAMVCAIATMIACLERCIQAIWKIGGGEVLERTRMYGEVTQILRRKILRNWGVQGFFEMERLLGGGIPFTAHAVSLERTKNNVAIVDTENYRPKHVTPRCSCTYVKPSLSALRELIRTKRVPVVTFDGTDLVVHSASDTGYVAISHVWADGLGSTAEVGLPRCQVERLSRLSSKLTPNGAFWQDGLCIPEEKELRKAAITLMATTYADADKVLVLDEGIRTACSLSSPKEECLLRIATSGWMQRIWTLQEGMLACELHFEVGNEDIIDCTHFNGFPFALARKVLSLLEYRCLDERSLTYKTHLTAGDLPRCTVNDLIGLLRYRSTSKSRDEPVAISGLLGIDAAELIHFESAEERMKSLLINARVLPRQLVVFGWFNLRSSLPNFGWAPRSLSDILWPGDADDPFPAICTEDGLFSDFTVVRFTQIELAEPIGVMLNIIEPGQNEPRPFNLVLSPPFVRAAQPSFPHFMKVGGFLMKGAALLESTREEGVAAVTFPSDGHGLVHPVDGHPTLTCKWVAPASVRFGPPDQPATSRWRLQWEQLDATVHPLQKVRVT